LFAFVVLGLEIGWDWEELSEMAYFV